MNEPIWFEAARLGGRIAATLRAESAGAEPGADANWGRVLRFLDAQLGRAESASPIPAPQPIDTIAEALDLNDAERDLLVLAGMAEEHEGYGAAFAALHPRGDSRPTWGLFAWLVSHGNAEPPQVSLIAPGDGQAAPRGPGAEVSREAALRLFNDSALIRLGIVHVLGDAPLPERTLRLADGLWSALHGIDAWPSGVSPLPPSDLLDAEDDWLAATPARRALQFLAEPQPHTVLVRGLQPAAVRMRAQQLARAATPPGLVFEWPSEPPDGPNGRNEPDGPHWLHKADKPDAGQLPALLAHCLVRGAMPVLLTLDAPLPAAHWSLLDGYPRPVVLAGMQAGHAAHTRRSVLPLEALPLSAQAQCDLWRSAMPELAEQAEALSTRYPIWPETIQRLRRDLGPWIEAGDPPTIEQTVAALKTRIDQADENFARRITPRATWNDLVLPDDKLAPLRDAVDRVRLQFRVLDEWGFARSVQGRRGLRILFSGLPGTGKTLAAEVLAQALHADLLVVDLARMVSKWLGETEKNLASAFDQAEATGAVLFFDEADALFGKRTEVSDAHDRYANIESAYLLARLERFDSVAILATNLRQNMDKAFLRRFEYAIDFAEPAPPERLQIWRRHLPAQAPLGADVDLGYFAALFPLSGAMIRNAALGAAFIAAGEGRGDVINRAHIERALRQEYEKSGRMCPV